MKKKWMIISACAAAVCGITGWKLYTDYQEREELKRRQAAFEETYEALKLDIDEHQLIQEYGIECNLSELMRKYSDNITFVSEVDSTEIGDHEVRVRLQDEDAYGETVEREFLYNVAVEDTKAPVINLVSGSAVMTEGDEFDLLANVESVTDPVDGDLDYSDTAGKGKWTLETDLDPETPGEYTVTVKACDINGNKAEATYSVTVEEKPAEPVIDASQGNSNPYFIRINRALNTVTVYALNGEGEYEPYTAFICSTGPATPLGTYTTFNKSRWRLLYGPCYGQYVTDIVGDILFHSVPYYTMYEGDLEYYEYNKLGTAASMGCIRLCVRDALWIYNNCPIGTVVELYDDWESYGPLGRPESIYIDPESPNRGWDPTDPAENNPWNN